MAGEWHGMCELALTVPKAVTLSAEAASLSHCNVINITFLHEVTKQT
jgi:hypothetical protein